MKCSFRRSTRLCTRLCWIAVLVQVAAAAGAVAATAAERPQLDAASAASHQAAHYLAQGPSPWQPVAVVAAQFKPDYVVAADGSGTHRSVQAAVDAVPAASAEPAPRRWLIHIKPGTYRGPLCVRDKAPLALYGTPGAARAAVLVDGRYNSLPKRVGEHAAQPCQPNLASATHGTSGSATAIVASADVLLAHLTFANDATEKSAPEQGAQAVALMTQADRIQLEDVRLVSHQDTFYVRRPAPGSPARVFVRGSVIEGDVDFIFGNATLVVDDSTLVSRAGRLPAGRGGYVLAPSTPAGETLGFLVQRSRFVAEAGVAAGSTALGRAWDEGVQPGQWEPGRSPNGQAVVRDSALGPHIAASLGSNSGATANPASAPWATSTSRRPFSASANRFAQFNNSALPADIAREGLAPNDGWAAAGGGTRGGADAAPADVYLVRNRNELATALAPHAGAPRPRIVKVLGLIDLSVDDAGKPLGADDYRESAFTWPAFAAAYEPAVWGRNPPAGPLEDARRASAARQAARVVLRVPSRTTLIGLGHDAHITGGSLFLDKVSDVIVRNLRFSDAYDYFPVWDPKDNQHGEWNSEYDNITLRGASKVWVDHCTFDDGQRPDAAEPTLLGRRMQRHDGLLDITRGSTHITVSWSHFRHHDKTSLVGGSDRHSEDEGRLKVTFHHNLWEQTQERSPRVRYGQVHLFNNLHWVHDAANFGYSIGVGYRSAVISQNEVWETPAELAPTRLVRPYGGTRFLAQGSLHNGKPVNFLELLRLDARGQSISEDVQWAPVHLPATGVDAAAEVAARVRAGAGAGRLWTGAP